MGNSNILYRNIDLREINMKIKEQFSFYKYYLNHNTIVVHKHKYAQ